MQFLPWQTALRLNLRNKVREEGYNMQLSIFPVAECNVMYMRQLKERKGEATPFILRPARTFERPEAHSIADIETRSTAAVTCCTRVVHDLELTSDQLGGVIDGTTMEQFKRRLVHDDLGFSGCISGRLTGIWFSLEDGVLFRINFGRPF